MEKSKQRTALSSALAKVWVSLVCTTLGAVASLVSALVTSAKLQSSQAVVAAVAAVGTVVLAGGFTFVLARRERGSSRVARLKDELTNAYLGALDNSIFNPLRGGSR